MTTIFQQTCQQLCELYDEKRREFDVLFHSDQTIDEHRSRVRRCVEDIDAIIDAMGQETGRRINDRFKEELAWYAEKMATANPAMKAERLQ